ncbi:nucleoside hydrolase [Kineococcus terrestris]|uniref:nucleoside hydrolase n=1 Tax=Kineococcus terrestris TaxID=2044856 RepID=UPI0034DAE29E
MSDQRTENTVRSSVVVDTDTGIDDALALFWLAGRPDVRIAAVTAVFGNCTVEDATRNIGAVLALAGLPDVPVAVGAPGPVDGRAPHFADYVHGADGLGDLGGARPQVAVERRTAAEQLVHLANSAPGEHDLLVLGPMTNVAVALELDPDLLLKFRRTAVMGGSGPFPPLGVAQIVDANVANDPVAARAVFAAPRTELVMAGVNVGAGVIVDEEAVRRLHDSPTEVGRFSAALLESYMDFYQQVWGRRVSPAWDGLAAGLLVEPRWTTRWEDGPVGLVPDGPRWRAHLLRTAEGGPVPFEPAARPGMPAPDTRVALEVDVQAFLDDFLGVLAGDGR